MKIILLGPPGAGKGSQATLIAEQYNIPHISTGDIFRKNLREKTELGKLAQSYMDKGELVPDDVTISMVEDRLKEDDARKGYLLDGFPRTTMQAESFDESNEIDVAINIDVPTDLLLSRITGRRMCACGATYHVNRIGNRTDCEKCGETLYQRDDDKEEVVQSRLKAYNEQTAPLIEHYGQRGKLITIDGNRDIDVIFEKLQGILGAYL